MGLKISVSEVGDVTILRLDGRIVIGEESRSFRQTVQGLVDNHKRKIILNLADVKFLDSGGNGDLVCVYHSIRSHGGLLKLCHVSGKFQEVLQIQKLLTVYDVYPTEADALQAFGLPSRYCLCPACGESCGPSLVFGSNSAVQTCVNPACKAQLAIDYSRSPKDLAPITRLTFQTYERESFDTEAGAPFRCHIVGRLDLFSSSALQKSWLAIPSPRRVVFDLSRVTEINEAGRAALMTLLAHEEQGSKATASLEGLKPGQTAPFPKGAPFFARMADAVKALGDVSDTPCWLARISEDSELPHS